METYSGLDFERPILELETKIAEIRGLTHVRGAVSVDLEPEIQALEEKRDQLMREIFSTLTPWQRVQLARHPKRPYTRDYIGAIFNNFLELHGDRCFGDDPALVGGLAFLEGNPVVVMGHQKGRNLEESLSRNFGMMHPEGYRKALRLMQLAEKFKRPIITFIDTAGAYPGIGAEERGQAEAIARNLRQMALLKVPSISVVIGEGGSGGALGIGVTDRILMLENSWYSVISPEGCAAILFRDASKAPQAAQALKITAKDSAGLGIVDEVIPEPLGGAHRDFESLSTVLKGKLLKHLQELSNVSAPKLLKDRYQKYRTIGSWTTVEDNASKPKKKKQ